MLRMILLLSRLKRDTVRCVECGHPHSNRNRNNSFTAFCSKLCYDLGRS